MIKEKTVPAKIPDNVPYIGKSEVEELTKHNIDVQCFSRIAKTLAYVDHSGLYIYLKAAYEVMMNQNQYNAESI